MLFTDFGDVFLFIVLVWLRRLVRLNEGNMRGNPKTIWIKFEKTLDLGYFLWDTKRFTGGRP